MIRVGVISVLLLSFAGISGCSSVEPVASEVKRAGIKTGKFIGLIDESTMKVPDYYATQYLPRKYQMNQYYDLDDIGCDANRTCKNQ